MTAKAFTRLDYDDADLLIRTVTRMEREVRAHSCRKEPETVEWLQALGPGDVLWDVGANVGAYSLIAASRGATVVAFEPDHANLTALDCNARMNALAVTVMPVALGDTAGIRRLSSEQGKAAGATHSVGDEGTPTLVLTADQLASWGLPQPSAVKIDVDGGEVAVVDGAVQTLAKVDTVLVEVTSASQALVEWRLGNNGLRLKSVHPHASGVTNLIFRR